MKTLESILHPYPVNRFLTENWSQRGVFIPSEQPEKFQHLFSWQQLNHLLNFHKPRHPELRFALNGRVLPANDSQDWVKYCKQGASLVLSRVNERVLELADVVWALQQEMGHSKVHFNTYCSWPSQQGFNCHYDTHEAFILQIDGQKEWFVFEDTLKYPYREELSDFLTPPESSPYIHCVLKPGDVLYIPRGHWHYAIAFDQPSLHLTLGIRGFNGKDLLEWLVREIQEQESWRQNLPLVPDGDTSKLEEHVKQLLGDITVTLSQEQEKLTQRYARTFPIANSSKPEISLPNQVGFGIFKQGLETRFRQPKFQKVRVETLPEGGYQLLTANRKVTFKGLDSDIVENLVANLFSLEAFTVKDVAEWLPNCDMEKQILPLLSGLVKEGVFLVDNF